MAPLINLIHIFLCLVTIGQIQVVYGSSCVSRYSPKSSGTCIEASQCIGAALSGLCTNNPGTICCIPSLYNSSVIAIKNASVSRTTFYEMFGKTRRSASLYRYYIKALEDAGISTPEQIAIFTAQILYGTSNLALTEEDSDGLQYEGSVPLGNDQPGDGPKYRGRGIIPIRGRHMYKVLANGISQNLEDAPEQAAMPSTAFEIAAWLWKNGYQSPSNTSWNKRPLKDYATNSKFDFVMMTHAVYQDNRTVVRTQFPTWLRIIKILNATCPSEGQGSECKVGERQGVCKLAHSGCKGRSVENLCGEPVDIDCCVACNYPVDIVFVVDSSGSVGLNNFKLMKNFIIAVSMRFNVASTKDGTQVALIRYSSTADIIFDFNQHKGHAALKQGLDKVRYIGGATNTVLALNTALNDLFNNPASGVRGKSSGVSRIFILLTDGKTNEDLDVIREAADALREEGVAIFAVGIGGGVKESELKVIANDPHEEYMFLIESFRALKKIVPAIESASCNEPALLEPGAPVEIDLKRKEKKFFRYSNSHLDDLVVLLINQTFGLIDSHVSLADKNTIKDAFSSCDLKENFITHTLGLEALTNESFCSLKPEGGIVLLPSSERDKDKMLRAALVKMCTRKNLYAGFKGLSRLSTFEISLVNFSNTNFSADDVFLLSADSKFLNASAPEFPIQFRGYVGCIVSGSGALATILTYLILSLGGKSAELFMKGSSLQMKNTKSNNKNKEKKDKDEDSDKSDSEEEKTQKAVMISTPQARFQGLIRHVLLILSVINALKRRPRSRYYDEEITPLSNQSSQRQPDKKVKVAGNSESCIASDHSQAEGKKDASKENILPKSDSSAGRKPSLDNGNLPFVGSTSLREVSSVINENITTKLSHARRFLGGKNENPSANRMPINEQRNTTGNLAGGIESVIRNSSKRHLAAMIFPCFTLFTSNDYDGETDQYESEEREKCFENDMHVSQAFCVLAIQAIFMLLIKSRENEIACTAAAISINYLYLATMVWLLIEGYYLCHMARERGRKRSGIHKGIFYVIAWGCPLVLVPIMMIKHTRYMANPHCWISMSSVLDLAVSVPFFAVGLVQLIVFGMLLITLCTYKNPSNDGEKEFLKDKLKTGLRNTFCISLLVLASWAMATISVNVSNDLYQTAFAAVNSAMGGALLLFYVLLNKDRRQAALKLLGKIGLSKKSVNLKDMKLGQVPGLQGKGNGSKKVKLEGLTSLKNTITKDPTRLLSFGSDLTKDNQQRTTLVQGEDLEDITSLINEGDSDGYRRSNRNKTTVNNVTDKDEDDEGGSTTKTSSVKKGLY